MDSSKNTMPAAAQSVERAAALLRVVAAHGPDGARLLDVASETGLARPTAHRLLKQLCAERLLTQGQDRRYLLGSLLYELGLAAPSPIQRLDRMRPRLQALADLTGDTAYLVMRSGDEAVCLDLAEGSYPIRARTFEIGARRPLGMGAAGLALLAAQPSSEARAIIERNADSLNRHGLPPATLLDRLGRAQPDHAVSLGTITEGVIGIAVVVPAQVGIPYLAVSIAAISSRIPDSRLPLLFKELRTITHHLAVIEASGGSRI